MSERAEDFRVGQRVRLTKYAKHQGLQGRATSDRGTVRRLGSTAFQVFVQRDGIKGTESYHCKWWEPLRGSPTRAGGDEG